MVPSVVSRHGHRGLLATPGAPEEGLPKAAEVLESAQRTEMTLWTEEKSERGILRRITSPAGALALMRYDNIRDLFTNNIVKDG